MEALDVGLQTQLCHLFIEGAAVDAQFIRRLLAVPVIFPEDSQDDLPLIVVHQIRQVLLGPDRGMSPGVSSHFGGQISHINGKTIAGSIGSLDDIIQLPDVAGPDIACKAAFGLR